VFLLHDEHVAHPLHELHEGPPWPEHLSALHASPRALNAEEHASKGPRQPWTSTFTSSAPPSAGSFCPERHRLSDRTHASSARKEAADESPAMEFSPEGGAGQPSSSTHWETVAMLVSARTQTSSIDCWEPPSPTRYAHSSCALVKSVSIELSSQPPPARQASHRDVTSATHAASVG
jgi:hypothetical protein